MGAVDMPQGALTEPDLNRFPTTVGGSHAPRPLRLGSLCTGYGGLDLAVEAVIGASTVWLSEIDDAPAQVCDVRFPLVPNLGDLTVIDWSNVEPVDVISAGYPCQPFSAAGRRKGTNDVRHLWPFIAEAVRVLRPRLVVLENVAGHRSLGFGDVLGELARIGYVGSWESVRASDVGACHRRERVFIVARDASGDDERHDGESRCGSERRAQEPTGGADRPTADPSGSGAGRGARGLPRTTEEGGRSRADVHAAVDARQDAPDADLGGRDGRESEPRWSQGRRVAAAGIGQDVPADAHCRGLEVGDEHDGGSIEPRLQATVEWGDFAPAIHRHEALAGRPAPRPVDDRGRLAPLFVEWMMCLPAGWVTDVLTSRSKALKCLGNGVVPPQAAFALATLLPRLVEAQEVAA